MLWGKTAEGQAPVEGCDKNNKKKRCLMKDNRNFNFGGFGFGGQQTGGGFGFGGQQTGGGFGFGGQQAQPAEPEEGSITVDKGIFDFYKDYFDGIKSFE